MTGSSPVKREILNLLLNEHLRLTPIHLERAVIQKFPTTPRHAVREELRDLISSGHLRYTQHFSTTHLEINYNRPVQVSNRIILCPCGYACDSGSNHIVIKLRDGSSFGIGDHPTTRMMLHGIEVVLGSGREQGHHDVRHALDIGTGSGVLALAAAAFGVEQVEGIDIDSMACHEAKINVNLNGLKNRIHVSQIPLEAFSEHQFDLVIANLRPPTIRELMPTMLKVSSSKSVWIISGCRPIEKNSLIKILPQEFSNVIWQEDQNNWSAFAVKRH